MVGGGGGETGERRERQAEVDAAELVSVERRKLRAEVEAARLESLERSEWKSRMLDSPRLERE